MKFIGTCKNITETAIQTASPLDEWQMGLRITLANGLKESWEQDRLLGQYD
jgi:hypothetical protein